MTDENGPSNSDTLILQVYQDLREIAERYLSDERNGHTLQPTALVHEAYLRLLDQPHLKEQSRTHFGATAARVMRQVLVDHARKRTAKKRGGKNHPVPLQLDSTSNPNSDSDEEIAKQGWIRANSGLRTHPVGGLIPNAFGLYDMCGNGATMRGPLNITADSKTPSQSIPQAHPTVRLDESCAVRAALTKHVSVWFHTKRQLRRPTETFTPVFEFRCQSKRYTAENLEQEHMNVHENCHVVTHVRT